MDDGDGAYTLNGDTTNLTTETRNFAARVRHPHGKRMV